MRNKRSIIFSVILLCFLIALIIESYGSLRTSEYYSAQQAVENAVYAYQNQDNFALRSCYGKRYNDVKEDSEIAFQKKFYLSIDADKVKVADSEVVAFKADYSLIGIFFEFLLHDGTRIPYYEYYTVYKTKAETYRIVTKNDCPRQVIDYFEENSEKYKDTKLYQSYLQKEKVYAQEKPDYADQIYGKFTDLMKGLPTKMEENLRFLGVIFLMAILQLWVLYTWAMVARIRRNKSRKRYTNKDNKFKY